MKYPITPFIIAVVGAILYALYTLVFLTARDERKSMSLVLLGFMVPTLALIVGADYLMQKFIHEFWVVVVVQLAILIAWGAYQIRGRFQ